MKKFFCFFLFLCLIVNPRFAQARTNNARDARLNRASKRARIGLYKGYKVVVVIKKQRLYAYKGHKLAFSLPVSTGKKGHPTPKGIFRIDRKDKNHRSSLYKSHGKPCPMKWAMRFAIKNGVGYWLHAGRVPGYPASHGCVRLPTWGAKKLYRWLPVKALVVIK